MAQLGASEMRTRRSIPSASSAGGGFGSSGGGGNQGQSAYGNQGQSAYGSQGHSAYGNQGQSAYGNQGQSAYGNQGYSSGPSGNGSWGGGYGGSHGRESGEPPGGKEKMSKELWWTFCLLLVTAACLHADQNLAAPNLSAIAEDFQMTPLQKDTRLGGMVQFGFFLIGGAVSLVVGPATDQVDRVTLLSVVVLFGCVPSLMMSLWVPSTKAGFFYFFLARICTGIAIGGSFPVLFSLSADLFPASQRMLVSTSISAATNVGAAVGGMMAGIIGPRLGWRLPFRFVACPALICAILVRIFISDPRTVRQQKRAKEESMVANPAFSAWMGAEDAAPSAGHVRIEELDFMKFKRILEVRTNMLIFAQALPGCIPISCICTFLSDYLSVEQGMQVQASTAVTACFGVSALCFAVGGGFVGQRLYNRRKDQLPLLIMASTCCAAVPFMLIVNSPKSAITSATGRPTLFALLLALMGGCNAVTGPNIRAILMNVNDGEVRGTVFSAFTLFDDLGKGLGPSIIVAATAVFGRRMAYTLSFALWWLSGAILFQLRYSLPRDAAKHGGSLLPTKSK